WANVTMGAFGLVVAGERLYFTVGDGTVGDGTVQSCDTSLFNFFTHALPDGNPRGIAANGTHVYWANPSAGVIARAQQPNGLGTNVIVGEASPLSVAVSATYVHWTTATEVRQAPLEVWNPVTSIAEGEARPLSLVVDGESLYWVEANL